MDDTLENEKAALDSALGNLARQDRIEYESRICDARRICGGAHRFLSASVAVFYPDKPIICWEIRCKVKPDDPRPIYVYESGKAENPVTDMDSLEDAVREIRSRLSEYMETGYREIAEKAMAAERERTLAAIDSLPG